MFERFTESARRTLFFSRFEVGQLGGLSIKPEHVLLGLIREGRDLLNNVTVLRDVPLEALRIEIERSLDNGERLPTSHEIPFAPSTQRLFGTAVQEADRLGDRHIGTEHLLLSLLVEEDSAAAAALRAHGLTSEAVRSSLASTRRPTPPVTADVFDPIDDVKRLVDELAQLPPDSSDARAALVRRIHNLLDTLRGSF